MRRLTLLPLLLAPLPGEAQAQDAFCTGVRTVVAGAAQDFAEMPLARQIIHGSVTERRGMTPGDPPRAAFYAIMLRDNSERAPRDADARFRALEAEITRCLPQAAASGVNRGDRGSYMTWTLERAVVGLRSEIVQGFATSGEVELSISSRW